MLGLREMLAPVFLPLGVDEPVFTNNVTSTCNSSGRKFLTIGDTLAEVSHSEPLCGPGLARDNFLNDQTDFCTHVKTLNGSQGWVCVYVEFEKRIFGSNSVFCS